MQNEFRRGSSLAHVGPDQVIPRRLLLIAVLFLRIAAPSWAGECLTSDKELYDGVVASYGAAKKGELAEHDGWGMRCWSGNEGLDARLKTVLTDMLFDSRIHPAHVAAALDDYQNVFGKSKGLLDEVKKKQGPWRYAQVAEYRDRTGIAFTAPAAPEAPSGDIDYIDGPANVRKQPRGQIIASLPDNTRVRVLKTQEKWVEIEAGSVRGWTARTNLMTSHVGAADADGFYVLSRAAYMGYSTTVRFLLDHGAKADLIDGSGRNALHWAVKGGFAGLRVNELSIVHTLAAAPGVNANLVDKEGTTPLLDAISLDRADMANVLLGMPDIDVNLPGKEGVTPLIRAITYQHSEIVTALLNAKGLDVNAVDARGRTALYHAVALGDRKTVAALLERKARTDTVTKDGKTLLHAAFEPKPGRLSSDPANIELVKLLAPRTEIDINKEDGKGMTAMVLAIDQDQPDIVKLLLSRSDLDVNKRTAAGDYLNRAIRHSRLRHGHEMAMMLLDREEIDVNVPYYQGETLVHLGWYSTGTGTRGLELVNKIFTRRPDLNRENEYGETPLVYNINQDRPESVRLLAGTKGVDLNRLITRENRTPLGQARYRGNAEIIDILQKAGAREFNFVGNEETTPEGIPQALLQNASASQAIIFYRGYLLSTTSQALADLRGKRTDDAVQHQEFILDEIVAEMGDHSMPKYSAEQRKRALGTFTAIKDHYNRYPRSQSAWFKALPAEKKVGYAKLDMARDEILNGKYDGAPGGDLTNHPPMVPILILRDYMAKNSIKALGMVKEGKTAEAEQFLAEVIRRSDPSGSYKPE